MKKILLSRLAASVIVTLAYLTNASAAVSETDRKKLYSYLAKVQREAYNVQTIGPDNPLYKLAQELLKRQMLGDSCKESVDKACPQEEALDEILKKADETLPTEYEDARYHLVEKLASRISEAAGDIIDFPPIIGTLPTTSFNACTLFIDDPALTKKYPKARIIVFNRELFNFALLFGKAIVAASRIEADFSQKTVFQLRWPQPFTSDDEQSKETFEGVYRFYEVMHAVLRGGRPSDVTHYLPDPQTQIASHLLIDAMELFIMGHEFAHVILDHKPIGRTRVALMQGSGISPALRNSCAIDANDESMTFNQGTPSVESSLLQTEVLGHEQEFQADIVGMMLMTKALKSSGQLNSLTIAAPFVFFDLLDVLDDGYESVLGRPRTPSITHPPGAERYAMLQLAINDERLMNLPVDRSLIEHLHVRVHRTWELASILLRINKMELEKAQ